MVRNDVIWVWVRIVANGVARAVVNGSEPSRMVQTIVPNGLDRRREWFRAVANGSDRRE